MNVKWFLGNESSTEFQFTFFNNIVFTKNQRKTGSKNFRLIFDEVNTFFSDFKTMKTEIIIKTMILFFENFFHGGFYFFGERVIKQFVYISQNIFSFGKLINYLLRYFFLRAMFLKED